MLLFFKHCIILYIILVFNDITQKVYISIRFTKIQFDGLIYMDYWEIRKMK